MATVLEHLTDFSQFRNAQADRWSDLRNRAWEAFQALGLPSTKHEEWRFTSLRPIAETTFDKAPAVAWTEAQVGLGVPDVPGAIRVAVVNGRFSAEGSDVADIPAGLTVGPYSQTASHPAWDHLGSIVDLSANPLGALNTASFDDPILIHVGKGAVVEKPIQLAVVHHHSDRPYATFPRLLVVAEEHSESTILETHSGDSGVYLAAPVTEVFVAPDARLEHTRVQQESEAAYHVGLLQVKQAAKSVYVSNAVSFGGKIGRNDINVWLDGEHVECWLNGAYMAFGDQLIDNHTRLDHAFPYCNSFQVYKGILGGAGAGVFNGKIYVHPDAQKTDAKQTNKALLLSPHATINTKPQLEIFADDVKCTHGATVGQLSAESLFYLRSRGIGLEEANGILTYAFVSEVLEKISTESVRDALEQILFRQVSKTGHMPEA